MNIYNPIQSKLLIYLTLIIYPQIFHHVPRYHLSARKQLKIKWQNSKIKIRVARLPIILARIAKNLICPILNLVLYQHIVFPIISKWLWGQGKITIQNEWVSKIKYANLTVKKTPSQTNKVIDLKFNFDFIIISDVYIFTKLYVCSYISWKMISSKNRQLSTSLNNHLIILLANQFTLIISNIF